MGIAQWRLKNARKSEDHKRIASNRPEIIDENDDMEMAYVHVRYQKSFDVKEEKEKEEQYNQMKQTRRQIFQPITSMGIKKFSKQYEKLRKEIF